MFDALASLGIIVAFILLRVGELRLHKQNYDFLNFAGAQEEIPHWMQRYYFLEWMFLGLGIVEISVFPKAINNLQQIIGLIILMVFAGLRIWSINSLGKHWSMRCLFVAGFPVVRKGPYRFLKHPEYLSRFGEMLGISLFWGTYIAFGAYVLGAAFLLKKILLVERKQIQQFSISDSY